MATGCALAGGIGLSLFALPINESKFHGYVLLMKSASQNVAHIKRATDLLRL
jgi:hypothetical protein